MDLIELLWDFSQQNEINNLRQGARRSEMSAGARIDSLERMLDRLTLVTLASWELLSEKTDLTEKDLAAKMEEIDLRDGKKDGKATLPGGAAGTCASCSRRLHPRHDKCVYCGGTKV